MEDRETTGDCPTGAEATIWAMPVVRLRGPLKRLAGDRSEHALEGALSQLAEEQAGQELLFGRGRAREERRQPAFPVGCRSAA